ncbi:MAG: phosphate ABC transporter substrate-binding protein [Bacteroidales bacterium]|nr:phosphate ABC transporter substrate-binding protein [Bacteroidales bacterium]
MRKYIFLLMILAIGITANAQGYKVIVNQSNSTSTLSEDEISKLFLKKNTKWADGKTVDPIDQVASSGVRKIFTDGVHKKSVSAIKSYWQQAIFAGIGTPPLEKSDDEEVIKYVSQNAGAIGYVSAGANISGVKELKVSR